MKQWFTKQRLIQLLGFVLGLAGGYAYYRLAGCTTGTCPLTSTPWISALWGGAIGWLLTSAFLPAKSSAGGDGKASCPRGGCHEE
jgi:hypothetical protein